MAAFMQMLVIGAAGTLAAIVAFWLMVAVIIGLLQ